MTDKMDYIQTYCDQLSAELKGSDSAIIMDATNDAYEYFSSEIKALHSSDSEKTLEQAYDEDGPLFSLLDTRFLHPHSDQP